MNGQVVVTGSAGFVGTHAVAALADRGWDVRGLDLRSTERDEQVDIRRPLPAAALSGADVVLHLAALGGVRPSLRHPARYVATNVTGTAHVLAAARRAGVTRVVVASSSSVLGECPEPAPETAALAPLSPYARTKVAAERLARSAGRDLEVVVVRPFTVYGPGQRPDMLVARLLAGDVPTLWPFERDLTFVGDLAPALAAACQAPLATSCPVVHLGTGSPVTADRLVKTVAKVTGRDLRPDWGPVPDHEPVRTWADTGLAHEWLGFRATTSLDDGIAAQADAVR